MSITDSTMEVSKMRKIVITDELKNVLTKMNHELSNMLVNGEVDESCLVHPEKNFNYFDLSHTSKGHLSYLNQDRIDKIEAEDKDFWNVKKRYHAKPGSVMKKLFKTNNWEIETFVNQFVSIVDPPEHHMEVVKGDDIAKYYNYNNYYEQRGSLGGSCMKSSPTNFFDIYVNNPDLINMLVMLNQHDKVMGRAILWNGNGLKLMDRVYVSGDNYSNYFYDWARENDYSYKEFTNWYTPKHWVHNNEKNIKEFELDIKNVEFENYPYLDSFKWLDKTKNKIYNYIPKNKDLVCISDHMGRALPGNYFDFCDISNGCYLSCDIVHLDYINKNVYTSNLNWSEVFNKYILREHSRYMNEIKDYIFNEEFDQYNDKTLIENKKKKLEEKELNSFSNDWDINIGLSAGIPRYYGRVENIGDVEQREPEEFNGFDSVEAEESLRFESVGSEVEQTAEPIERPPLAQPLSFVELDEIRRVVDTSTLVVDNNWGEYDYHSVMTDFETRNK